MRWLFAAVPLVLVLALGGPVAAALPSQAFAAFHHRSLADGALSAHPELLLDLERDEVIRLPGRVIAWRPDEGGIIVRRDSRLAAHFADGRRLPLPAGEAAAWSSRGLIAVHTVSRRVVVLNEAGARVHVVVTRPLPYLAPVSFSPDGAYLLAGHTIRDTSGWRIAGRLDGAGSDLAAWSPDSRKLAVLADRGAVYLWRAGSRAAQLLDRGWQHEAPVWRRPPEWTADSRTFFVGTGVYGCCSIPVQLLLSRVRQFVIEGPGHAVRGDLPPALSREWVDLDSPAVSERGFIAARSGSCRRHDLTMQAIPNNIPRTRPWPVALSSEDPGANPSWVRGGRWLAYTLFPSRVVFLDPEPRHEPHDPVDATSFIGAIRASPRGRFLEVYQEPRNVAPGVHPCHGGLAY